MKERFFFSPGKNSAHLINWYHWDKEVFEKAIGEDKVVLLNLTARWCHWCHVMDETTYSDPDVISFINREIIPIRVDTDRNPHIQDRYLSDGWPTNAFLTPQGDILLSSTYINPQRMKELLSQITTIYRERREEIYREIEKRKAARNELLKRDVQFGEIDLSLVDQIYNIIDTSFDPVYGGFGEGMKFPQPYIMEFLFDQFRRRENRNALHMAKLTLERMMNGDIYDKVEKGFFRYATSTDWSKPHYEKMLEDNALLMRDYSILYKLTEDSVYRRVAEEIGEYLMRCLFDRERHCFYGSQDADEEYYQLPSEERKRRKPPLVDDTIYTNKNCIASYAFMTAGRILGRPDFIETGLGVLDFIVENAFTDKGLYHYFDGADGFLTGLFVDIPPFIFAAIEASVLTDNKKYTDACERVVKWTIDNLYDGKSLFVDRKKRDDDFGELRYDHIPLIENIQFARGLIRMGRKTEDGYLKIAENILRSISTQFERFGLFSAPFGTAIEEFFDKGGNQ